MAFVAPFMATYGAAIGAGVSAIGMISNGINQSNTADYNAQVASQNAEIARQQGVAAQTAQAQQAKQKIGLMIASYGSSGVSGDAGSPLDILGQSAAQAKLDNLNIGYNANLKATGFDNTATLDKAQGDNALTSGILSAVGQGASGYAKYSAAQAGTPIPIYGNSMTTTSPKNGGLSLGG